MGAASQGGDAGGFSVSGLQKDRKRGSHFGRKSSGRYSSTLRPQMITLWSVTGVEFSPGPFTFRRDNNRVLVNSSKLHVGLLSNFRVTGAQAFITESQRNPGPATSHQRMRYPSVCSALQNMQGSDLYKSWFILNFIRT